MPRRDCAPALHRTPPPAPSAVCRRDRRTDDVDLDFCARQFELAGGHIRSIALTAAYLAAGRGSPVCMADLMAATQREYRKLGRLVVRAEFDTWFDLNGSGGP